jgi:hypothetical protein
MLETIFKGVFEQGDGIECVTEISLKFVEDEITGVDKSEHGDCQIQGYISSDNSNIIGTYSRMGTEITLGRFKLSKTEHGYEGQYLGTLDDGTNFKGYYKWLNN